MFDSIKDKESQDAVIFTVGLCQQLNIPIVFDITSSSQETFHKMLVEHKKPDRELFAGLIYAMITDRIIVFSNNEECIESLHRLKDRYDNI